MMNVARLRARRVRALVWLASQTSSSGIAAKPSGVAAVLDGEIRAGRVGGESIPKVVAESERVINQIIMR